MEETPPPSWLLPGAYNVCRLLEFVCEFLTRPVQALALFHDESYYDFNKRKSVAQSKSHITNLGEAISASLSAAEGRHPTGLSSDQHRDSQNRVMRDESMHIVATLLATIDELERHWKSSWSSPPPSRAEQRDPWRRRLSSDSETEPGLEARKIGSPAYQIFERDVEESTALPTLPTIPSTEQPWVLGNKPALGVRK